MLIPVTCPICGARGGAPCQRCRSLLKGAPSLPVPAGLDGCHALLDYDGAGRELVARLKYRNARASVTFLARAMASLVDGPRFGVVTWAPTTDQHRRHRGFDQAEVLARAVAACLGVPCRGLLRRLPGPAQTGQPSAARWSGPTFQRRGVQRFPRARLLLVDDVVTTGATVVAAARVLRSAGATEVVVLAAARTRPGRSRGGAARAVPGRVRAYTPAMVVCGSVVESRCQPRAKRPT